jgi:hypothetical protein
MNLVAVSSSFVPTSYHCLPTTLQTNLFMLNFGQLNSCVMCEPIVEVVSSSFVALPYLLFWPSNFVTYPGYVGIHTEYKKAAEIFPLPKFCSQTLLE